jgi:hypothetical protein
MKFLNRLVGWRTVAVNVVLVAGGILRTRNAAVPDDATLATIANGVLDVVFSVPGAGVINLLLRLLTSTPVFTPKP